MKKLYSGSQLNEVQFEGESRDILPGLSMKAYSLDLRQKIIDTYNSEKISQRQLAKQFRVALSFVEKLLKRYRQTGEIGAYSFESSAIRNAGKISSTLRRKSSHTSLHVFRSPLLLLKNRYPSLFGCLS